MFPMNFLVKSLSLVRCDTVRCGTSSTKVRKNHCIIIRKPVKTQVTKDERFLTETHLLNSIIGKRL